jgi:hypothetical protein
VEEWLHAFLTSTLKGGKWSTSSPGLFTLRKELGTIAYKAG